MPRSLNEPVWLLPHYFTEIFHTQDFSAVQIRPEEVRVALEHGGDILVIDAGQDPFLLAPPDP